MRAKIGSPEDERRLYQYDEVYKIIMKKDEPCYTCLVYPMCKQRYLSRVGDSWSTSNNKKIRTNNTSTIFKVVTNDCSTLMDFVKRKKKELDDFKDITPEPVNFSGFFISNPFEVSALVYYTMGLK